MLLEHLDELRKEVNYLADGTQKAALFLKSKNKEIIRVICKTGNLHLFKLAYS